LLINVINVEVQLIMLFAIVIQICAFTEIFFKTPCFALFNSTTIFYLLFFFSCATFCRKIPIMVIFHGYRWVFKCTTCGKVTPKVA
jgi:hypothetical protein